MFVLNISLIDITSRVSRRAHRSKIKSIYHVVGWPVIRSSFGCRHAHIQILFTNTRARATNFSRATLSTSLHRRCHRVHFRRCITFIMSLSRALNPSLDNFLHLVYVYRGREFSSFVVTKYWFLSDSDKNVVVYSYNMFSFICISSLRARILTAERRKKYLCRSCRFQKVNQRDVLWTHPHETLHQESSAQNVADFSALIVRIKNFNVDDFRRRCRRLLHRRHYHHLHCRFRCHNSTFPSNPAWRKYFWSGRGCTAFV